MLNTIKRMDKSEIFAWADGYGKGQRLYFKALTDNTSNLTSENRKSGIEVFHLVGKVTASGVDYENMKATKEKRANGIEPSPVHWGHYLKGYENCVLEHNKSGQLYLSFKFSDNTFDNIGNESKYIKVENGKETEISFDDYLNLCKPSVRKAFESGEKPPVLLVKFENIISLGKK